MPSTSRDDLIKYIAEGRGNEQQLGLAQLILEYSEIKQLRKTYLASLVNRERIYPTILPTQASGRWSYIDPPLSNFPKKCINPSCPKGFHGRTANCWSLVDCIVPDKDTFWIEHDLDAVEHRIYCLILGWLQRLQQLKEGVDIHTPVTCDLFNLAYPSSLLDPHKSAEDELWRVQNSWQGKDDSRRTISKNFTYGGQYFYVRLTRSNEKTRKPYRIYQGLWYNPSFVYTIPNIQSFRVLNQEGMEVIPNYEQLAIRFVESTLEIQKRKAAAMEQCRVDKFSRTLYGNKRYAWFSNQDAAKKLFNHRIQGTVASYIDESVILLQKEFPDSYLVHNKHDSLKWAFRYATSISSHRLEEEQQVLNRVKELAQRTLIVGEYSIPITATFKIVRSKEND